MLDEPRGGCRLANLVGVAELPELGLQQKLVCHGEAWWVVAAELGVVVVTHHITLSHWWSPPVTRHGAALELMIKLVKVCRFVVSCHFTSPHDCAHLARPTRHVVASCDVLASTFPIYDEVLTGLGWLNS
jgi:hypothetical protein